MVFSSTSPDRRIDPRKAVNLRALVLASGFEVSGVVVEMSEHGLRLKLDRQMALSGAVTVIDLAGGVAHEGAVAWSRDREAGLKNRTQSSLRGLTPARLAPAREAWKRAGGR